MRHIDMQSWPRRKHFALFQRLAYPYLNITATVDITAFYPFIKEQELSFNLALIYGLARVANTIPEFRYRIHGEGVVEHDIVHPATTIPAEDELFSFCTIAYQEDFKAFAPLALETIARCTAFPTLDDEPGQDNLLYMSAIPWVSFTSIVHPVPLHPADSVPRIAWGKFFAENGTLKLPLSVQGHHALMDGLHMGRYFSEVQRYLSEPALYIH
ncbi:MAG: chloramphenicol acetyltransferase [Ardenticatenales bacterium]|nr:chloramphenicol acetyltransferase [Ardenticatenales bacterium]